MNQTPAPIDVNHAILLVMDYQNGIVSRVPNVESIIKTMADTLENVRKIGMRVGYVRVALTDEEYTQVPPTNKLFYEAAQNRAMHADASETQIVEAVTPKPADIVVRKKRVGSFTTTDLDEQLRVQTINTVILAGFSTSGVVLSTVREAADRDYRIIVLEDASADRDAEVHDVLMQKVFPRQADVMTAAELTGLLEA